MIVSREVNSQLNQNFMNSLKNLLVAMMLTIILAPSAYAYLDATTGSIVLQAVIAGAVGSMFFIRLSWRKIKNFFKKILVK